MSARFVNEGSPIRLFVHSSVCQLVHAFLRSAKRKIIKKKAGREWPQAISDHLASCDKTAKQIMYDVAVYSV